MPHLHGFEGCDARTDQLPPAAVPGHQVRFDQPRRDLQFGLNVPLVDPRRHAVRRRAEVLVLAALLAVVVHAGVTAGDVRADEFDQFVAFVRAVQAGGDENRDLVARDAGRFERLE